MRAMLELNQIHCGDNCDLDLQGAERVQETFGGNVSGVGEFWGVEKSEIVPLTGTFDASRKLVAIFADAKKSYSIVSACLMVLLILTRRCFAQIVNAIVGLLSVNVVELFVRPRTCREEPNKSMGWIQTTVNHDVDISIRVQCAGDHSGLGARPAIHEPRQNAIFRVALQNGTESLRAYNLVSHFATYLCDSVRRFAGVVALANLRYFNMAS